MAPIPPDTPRLGEALALLERNLIDDFLRARGLDPNALRARTDMEARRHLKEAAVYAATRLTEVESRAHYVHDLHGGAEGGRSGPRRRSQ